MLIYKLKNNSKNHWPNFNYGHGEIDILPEAEFELEETAAKIVLGIVGHENWVVKTGEVEVEEPVVEEPVVGSAKKSKKK